MTVAGASLENLRRRDTIPGRAIVLEDLPVAVLERFLDRLEVEPALAMRTPHLVWPAATTRDGYGVVRVRPRSGGGAGALMYAHRLGAAISFGTVPADREVHHTCDVRRCVAHVELVDGPTNMAAVDFAPLASDEERAQWAQLEEIPL